MVEAAGLPETVRPMFTRCLFCRATFPENDALVYLRHGRRIAFDPGRGRLWTVCERCRRWNLCPIEERAGALYELERIANDGARLLGRTANISLLEHGQLTLIRVGRAGLAEQAWWRYGDEIRQRRAAHESRRSRLAAYTLGAVATLGEVLGLTTPDLSIDWHDRPVDDVTRWRRFGWAAWHGRESCPFCQSSLRALRYDLGWWVYPLRGPDGRLGLGVPCQRCDPWTPDKVYELHGDVAENTLRRLLAYQNVGGAPERRIVAAADMIERAGSVEDYAEGVAGRRETLWKLGPTATIGLEIALNETVERRMIDLEVRALEFLWAREEELARITDEELTPRRVLEAHLRRLPRARSAPSAVSPARHRPTPEAGR